MLLCGLTNASIGPYKSTLNEGEFSAGGYWSHGKEDVITTAYELFHCMFDTQHRMEDIKTDDYIVQLFYAPSDQIMLSLDVGVTEYEYKSVSIDEDLTLGMGFNATIYDNRNWSFGTLGRFLLRRMEYTDTCYYGKYPITTFGDVSTYEILLSIGANYDIEPIDTLIYAGPCLCLLRGHVDMVTKGLESLTIREDVENNHEGEGVLIGCRCNLIKNVPISFEYLATDWMYRTTVGIAYEF